MYICCCSVKKYTIKFFYILHEIYDILPFTITLHSFDFDRYLNIKKVSVELLHICIAIGFFMFFRFITNATYFQGLPVVQIPQNNYIDTYGKKVVIPCSIVSDSTVTGIYWEKCHKNKVERINKGDKGYQGIMPTSPSLMINFATSDDNGTYVCHAINAAGKSTSNSATLELNGG